MIKVFKPRNIALHLIWEECKNDFKPADALTLSDFQTYFLRLVGDVLRESRPNYESGATFWSGAKYCWFTSDKQDRQKGVFLTANNICIFEDADGELYRVEMID